MSEPRFDKHRLEDLLTNTLNVDIKNTIPVSTISVLENGSITIVGSTIQVPVDIQSNYYATVTVLPSGTYTTSTVTYTVPVGNYKEGNFFFNVSSVSAASTIELDILTIDPVSGESFSLLTFSTFSAVGKEMKTLSGNLGYSIVGTLDITGTVVCSLGAVLKP